MCVYSAHCLGYFFLTQKVLCNHDTITHMYSEWCNCHNTPVVNHEYQL